MSDAWNPPMDSASISIHFGWEPCDCGYEGPWEWRRVPAPDSFAPHVEERCPECGDIEVIDHDGRVIDRRVERGDVIDFVRERKRGRR